MAVVQIVEVMQGQTLNYFVLNSVILCSVIHCTLFISLLLNYV
jgi:hypothetical protein